VPWTLARDLRGHGSFGTETAILSGFVPTRGDMEARRKAARMSQRLRGEDAQRSIRCVSAAFARLPFRDFDNDGCLREIEYARDTLKVDGSSR
jgi:hypothetical protein